MKPSTFKFLIVFFQFTLHANATVWSLPDNVDKTKAKAVIDKHLEETDVPSVSVSYIYDGAIQWTVTSGHKSNDGVANNNTLYNTASIAKPIVGEVVLRLQEQGKMSLDEPMHSHYVDKDIVEDPRHKLLTPRIALSHQTGFKNWRYLTDGKLKFEWQPGKKRGYSGEGIRYLVRYLESKFGAKFDDIAQDVLFTPAGVKTASFIFQERFKDNQAWSFNSESGWRAPRQRKEAQGAGDLYISSYEYARLVLSVMDKNNEESVEAMNTIALNEVEERCKIDRALCPEKMGFSVGWYVYRYEDHTIFVHTGANTGERSLTLFSPELKFGMVVFANGNNSNSVIFDLVQLLYSNDAFIAVEKG